MLKDVSATGNKQATGVAVTLAVCESLIQRNKSRVLLCKPHLRNPSEFLWQFAVVRGTFQAIRKC